MATAAVSSIIGMASGIPLSPDPAAATPLPSLPSVSQIFATGRQLSQLAPGQLWNNMSIPQPDQFYPVSFASGLYYPIDFLWPQVEVTGIVPPVNCTIDVCSTLFGNFLYLPNQGANLFFAALFALCLLVNIGLAIKQRAWGHLAGMFGGLGMEIIGYIGRIMLHDNDFASLPFYLYIICLTIGPAFISASIYLCLARIVVAYGKHLSRFRPMTYTYIFVGCDFFSLILQGTGGGMAASFNAGTSGEQAGINIMIAGLAWQVFSLSVFMALSLDLALRIRRHYNEVDLKYREFRHSTMFQGFLVALLIATVAIFVRSVFRVAELQQGFSSEFANNEVTFMVLEAAMVSLASILLTAFHPTLVFGDFWRVMSGELKGSNAQLEKGGMSPGSPAEVALAVHNRRM